MDGNPRARRMEKSARHADQGCDEGYAAREGTLILES